MKGLEKLKNDPMVRRLLDDPPTATVPLVLGGTPVTVRTGDRVRFIYRGRDYEADVLRLEPWGWRCRPVGMSRWMSCSWAGIGAEA